MISTFATLKVVWATTDYFDPGLSYRLASWQLFQDVYLGLVVKAHVSCQTDNCAKIEPGLATTTGRVAHNVYDKLVYRFAQDLTNFKNSNAYFEREHQDPAWAVDREHEIAKSLETLKVPGFELQKTECRTTIDFRSLPPMTTQDSIAVDSNEVDRNREGASR